MSLVQPIDFPFVVAGGAADGFFLFGDSFIGRQRIG
jgi:hypothetical protein